MQQILKFFTRNRIGILFTLLFAVALGLTIQSHSYHNSKWVSSTNFITGFFFDLRYDVTSYFNLSTENQNLLEENQNLKYKLYNAKLLSNDSLSLDSLYIIKSSYVLSNSYNKLDNYVLIDKGRSDNVHEGYAVSIPNGILGIVEKSTNHYSRVISILNTNLSINAKLKQTNYFGSLVWDGKSPSKMLLKDLPRSASFKIGDTIVTGSNSLIFPENIPIGTVQSFRLDTTAGYYDIIVKLFADMTNLNQAYIIIPNKIEEAQNLLKNDESI